MSRDQDELLSAENESSETTDRRKTKSVNSCTGWPASFLDEHSDRVANPKNERKITHIGKTSHRFIEKHKGKCEPQTR
jgi:hypothetical protein